MFKLFTLIVKLVLFLPLSILTAFISILSDAAHGKIPGQRYRRGRRLR